jgi:hypothetical protein
MTSLQPASIKIQKRNRSNDDNPRNFICGGCTRSYKSYPALYLHVKRKHNGVMPPNTKTKKTPRPTLDVSVWPGRPNKPASDIDDVKEAEICLENSQNDLMSFLGEKLQVISDFVLKLSLDVIVTKIADISTNNKDKWFIDIQNECKKFLQEYRKKTVTPDNLDFEEDFQKLDTENGLNVIVWFLLWLANIFVKLDFVPQLTLIFAKIWKVVDQTQLSIQDLDNKLVWKKVMKECEQILDQLPSFKKDVNLLNEFIQKICQLCGKALEERNPGST